MSPVPGREPVCVWFLSCSVLRESCLIAQASLAFVILLPQLPDADLMCPHNSTELWSLFFLMPKEHCHPCLAWPVQQFCSAPLFEGTFLPLCVERLVTLPVRRQWCVVPQPTKQPSCLYGEWAQGSRFLAGVLWLDRGRPGIRARQVRCSCEDSCFSHAASVPRAPGELSSRPLRRNALYLPD